MKISIEVVASASMNSTNRGRLLECFARKLLESQNYNVTEEVRITGQEVDLLAVEKTTGERVIVECKAYRSTIAAEVIHKLFGQVSFNGFSSGWLISTYDLGKDAKGIRDTNDQKPEQERRKLRIYDPEKLVERLIGARIIVSPDTLDLPPDRLYAEECILLISEWGYFWAKPVLDIETRLRSSVLLFDATHGDRRSEARLNAQIAATDTTLAELQWETLSPTTARTAAKEISQDLQTIVQVPVADNWVDYRPARPQDFVGREQLQKDVLEIFEKSASRTSATRLFAVKAPSGWGKSSFALKIVQMAKRMKRGKAYFVYAVDSRAATSRRFGELALYSAIKRAMDDGFIERREDVSIGGTSAPFTSASSQEILRELREQGKVICLILDQFEELLYKEELSIVFDEIRSLCDSIVELQENILIGFSWKTDGTIPPEHRAYHLWHSLADRRREFELKPLKPSEVGTALNRFGKELGQPLSPQIRRTLSDHCQGYPWLLKKLCIHVLEQVRSGLDQGEILLRSLKIQELFDSDIQLLSSPEFECIKVIAAEAPADFFRVAQTFGDDVVAMLLDKRLVVRSGAKLSVYWDIFRDFLLTGRIPYIPTTYIPQANIGTYLSALRYVLENPVSTYDTLATKLHVSSGTADNIVRDLIMVGHVEANRSRGDITCISQDKNEAAAQIVAFCRSHVIYGSLLEEVGQSSSFSMEEAVRIARSDYPSSTVSDNLLLGYVRRVLQWCETAGLLKRTGGRFELTSNTPGVSGLTTKGIGRRGQNLFFGEAPPPKAIDALQLAQTGVADRVSLEKHHGRNAVYVLMNLGLVDARGNSLVSESGSVAETVRAAARQALTVKLVESFLQASGDRPSGLDVGAFLAEKLELTWSEGTKRRSGSALRRWTLWCRDN